MRARSFLSFLALASAGAWLVPEPVAAQCSFRTPSLVAPQQLWGTLEPVASATPIPTGWLSAARDTTNYSGFQFPDSDYTLWKDLDGLR